MHEYVQDQVLCWYQRLEKSVLDFTERVPLTPQNESLKAPALATILIDACSLLDSVFREMTPIQAPLQAGTKHKDKCDIADFAELHAIRLDLPNTRSIVLVSPPRYRRPFKPWVSVLCGEYAPLPWWQAHNRIKHDCLANLDCATLGNTLDALCALHQVLARRIDMVSMLMRHSWFPTGGYPVDYILDSVSKSSLPGGFIVQTRLFAVPTGKVNSDSSQFPEDLSKLMLAKFVCKPELIAFLGDCVSP